MQWRSRGFPRWESVERTTASHMFMFTIVTFSILRSQTDDELSLTV